MNVSLYEAARNLLALAIVERSGSAHHPFVVWAHELAGLGRDVPDETAWCGSSLGALCRILGLTVPSFYARARQWLTVGEPVPLDNAREGDIVIFKRGAGPQPGPGVLDAPGHVAIFEHLIVDDVDDDGNMVSVIGGNQRNSWTTAQLPAGDVLGVRRV